MRSQLQHRRQSITGERSKHDLVAQTPTKEGWYWFSELDGSNERIVNVYHQGLDGNKPLRQAAKTFPCSISTAIDWLDP